MAPKKADASKQQTGKQGQNKVDQSKQLNRKDQGSKPGKQSPEKDNKGKPADKKGQKEAGKSPDKKDAGKGANEGGKGKNDAGKPVPKELKINVVSTKSVQKLDLKGKKDDKNKKGEQKNEKGGKKDDKNIKGKSSQKDAKGKEVRDAKSKDQKKRNEDKGQKDGKDKKGQSPRGNEKSPPKGNQKNAKVAPPKPKKQEDIIKDSGLLEAYELFLRAVCKHGLPEGNVYEFAAQQIERYERKKRAVELKAKAEQQIQKAARRREERMQSGEND